MDVRGSAARLLAVSETAREHAQGEDLVAEMALGLSLAGEHSARLELQPTQGIVDFNWAARQAGRRLGVQFAITSTILKTGGQLLKRVRVLSPLR